jgi:hypothetical protein
VDVRKKIEKAAAEKLMKLGLFIREYEKKIIHGNHEIVKVTVNEVYEAAKQGDIEKRIDPSSAAFELILKDLIKKINIP